MSTQYVVVSGTVARGHTLYGPFPSVDAAQAWAKHPYRAEETRDRFEVLPLFGGLVLDDPPPPCEAEFEDFPCLYAAGHDGAHYNAFDMWSDTSRWTGVARP